MSGKTAVDPAELRASAQAEDAIADDMKDPNKKAISTSKDAAQALQGWAVGAALQQIVDSWKPSLDGMHARAKTGANNLRASASGHEWNERDTYRDFEKTGDEAQTQSGLQSMSAPASGPGAIGGPGAVGSEGTSPMPGADRLPGPGGAVGGPGAVGSEGTYPMPGANRPPGPGGAIGGPGAVGSEGTSPMPGADRLPGPGGAIGGPGAVGSEGTHPMPGASRPPGSDGPAYTGPDPGAKWTPEDMAKAKPMTAPADGSPFG
ncbi:hypothetical protein A6A06_21715 [Streptomyces sp. CB02923]|uniref:hypothetical protein n=1 Tax=Streptomyces sp. CB02923 TaxID=1718985 RepID=UPI00093F1C64|nr:hypothetical protein [Streptomyces sp. CB02923]OKH99707.1 hypothetical protein A6A06_21715 [Streptomyces sp. CB02923]